MKILLLTFLGISLSSHAASGPGNGGDALVCDDGTYQLLDFIEADIHFDSKPDFGDVSKSETEMAMVAIDRIKKLDPKRHSNYKKWVASFLKEAKFTSRELADIDDHGYIWTKIKKPKGCKVEQAAIQVQPDSPVEKRYTINKKIWRGLPKTHRAGLIVHEVIYRDALERNHRNSIAVRYLTGLISTKETEKLSTYKFQDLLIRKRMLGFRAYYRPFRKTFSYIYFEIALSQKEAVTFCSTKIPGSNTRLASTDFSHPRVYNTQSTYDAHLTMTMSNEIGRRILGTYGTKSEAVWTKNGLIKLTKLNEKNKFWHNHQIDRSKKYYFICEDSDL